MRCPYCKSDHIVRMGFNRNVKKTNGSFEVVEKQRYICHDCHRTTINPIDSVIIP